MGCQKRAGGSDAGTAIAIATTSDAGSDAGRADVDPVYAAEPNAPADPLAQRLYDALTSMPRWARPRHGAARRVTVISNAAAAV